MKMKCDNASQNKGLNLVAKLHVWDKNRVSNLLKNYFIHSKVAIY